MNDIVLIKPPAGEPVTPVQMMTQLGMGPVSDQTLAPVLASQLTNYISTARRDCENYTRRAFLTQTWLLRKDSFPGHNLRYEWNGYPEIELPKPPVQSISFFKYVDVSGTVQALTVDTTYGANPANPEYGYQFVRGSETQSGRLIPPFARPWPPTRMVPGNVIIQFRAGYGGPLSFSISANSAIPSVGGGFIFNPDDAPLLVGDTGTSVCIPGAGPDGSVLDTFVASVDGSGNATLATPATTAVNNVSGWLGAHIPFEIVQAIMFLAQFYYEQGSVVDQPLPRVVTNLLDPYRNEVA
jgi:hypothetical protein